MKIGHVHLKVRNLQRSARFYEKVLGLKIAERVGDRFVFFSDTARHHEIALQQVWEHAPSPIAGSVGLSYAAFEVPDKAAFVECYRRLKAADVELTPVNHRIGWSLHFTDPDGNGLEIYWDRRGEPGGESTWTGLDYPLHEEEILA